MKIKKNYKLKCWVRKYQLENVAGNVIFENKINFSSSDTKITPDIEVQFKKK